MKKYLFKAIALLLFTSVAVSSCSVEYRERRRHDRENRHHDDHHDDHDHNYHAY